jgi:hypothetical protein
MAVTKIKLSTQAIVDDNLDCQGHNLKALADPVDPQDAVTLAFLESVTGPIQGAAGVIGAAEDGVYTDGLFTDFVPTTPVGTAVDRFNEVLKSLTPQPAPGFSAISCNQTGVSGKLSFGAANTIADYTNSAFVNTNGIFAFSSGTRLGIFNASTALTGTLASNVTPGYANSRPYPNLAFGDANQGNLILELNGSVLVTMSLSGNMGTLQQLSANGSGFSVSAANSVVFTNGDAFAQFKYRTGTWSIAAADQIKGYNTLRISHEVGGSYRDAQVIDWVVDADATATTFSAEALNTLAMTGTRYCSGVNYHTAGTAKYALTVANAYRNTYSQSASAINYNGTNANIVDEALPAMTTQADSVVLTNKTATINATKIFNGSISVNTTIDRTVQADATSPGASISGLLLDNTVDGSSNTALTFNGESRRIHSGIVVSATNYGSGGAGAAPQAWSPNLSLVGADANHNTGLLVANGLLAYPKINFATIANGPAGNPDYSAAAGLRTFLGFFYDAGAHSNFRFNVTGASIAFVSVATGANANNLTFEVLAPNTTKNGSNVVSWKDAVVPHSGIDGDVGCYASTYGNVIPTNWGCTIGTKNTSTSGNVIVVKITAAAAWTGSISQVAITWL